MDAEAKISSLQAENAAMEAEIMALTKGSLEIAATKSAVAPATTGGIKVLKFGNNATAGGAGDDHGSSWCPPQCSRRTVLGGFFTS